jgi:hypothetical protein
MLGWTLFAVASVLEIWLLIIAHKARFRTGLEYLYAFPAYCIFSSLAVGLALLGGTDVANELTRWLLVGQDAVLALLCLDILYALRPEQRTLIGGTTDVGQWLLLISFLGYWAWPIMTVTLNHYALLCAASVLLLVIWRGPVVPRDRDTFGGESHRYLALALVVLLGLQSLCHVLYSRFGPITTNRISQACWIFGLACLITATSIFQSGARVSVILDTA